MTKVRSWLKLPKTYVHQDVGVDVDWSSLGQVHDDVGR